MKKLFLTIFVSIILMLSIYLIFNDLENKFQKLLLEFRSDSLVYSLYSILILSSDIVLPVPSSVIMYLNGSVLGTVTGFFVSFIAVTISSISGYFLGLFVSNNIVNTAKDKANGFIDRYGLFAIIISRGIPVLSESVSIACGYHKYNFKQYLLLSFAGYLPVCLVYAYFGNVGASEGNFLFSFVLTLLVSLLLWFSRKNMLETN